jgi:hypothetical protein
MWSPVSSLIEPDADTQRWEKRHYYGKRVIFVDLDTDVGKYRYTVDNGELKPK